MAALSLRSSSGNDFNSILQSNFNKADWFYYNGEEILKQLQYKTKYE